MQGEFVSFRPLYTDPFSLAGIRDYRFGDPVSQINFKEMEHRLDEVNITVNKNAIPNDPEKPMVTSGIRVGTPAITTRGFQVEDMPVIASCIWQAATDFEAKADSIRATVAELTAKYPIYE